MKKSTKTIILVVTAVASILVYTQLTIFIVQPIGAVPDGRTLIIGRSGITNFIDSADAICERTQGGVSLMCRVSVLGTIVNETTIYARLPYSGFLYGISTGGKTYDR